LAAPAWCGRGAACCLVEIANRFRVASNLFCHDFQDDFQY
jgi:hypothetical protein